MIAIDKISKTEIKQNFATAENDSGSPEVQIALMTSRVVQITKHLQINKKDFSGRRGLLIILGKRARLLSYLKRRDSSRYYTLIEKLHLKDKI
jgi:small subunit ribosomal protein S15